MLCEECIGRWRAEVWGIVGLTARRTSHTFTGLQPVGGPLLRGESNRQGKLPAERIRLVRITFAVLVRHRVEGFASNALIRPVLAYRLVLYLGGYPCVLLARLNEYTRGAVVGEQNECERGSKNR